MKYLPLLIFAVVVIGLLYVSSRARRRQTEAERTRRETIGVGTEVMTTSGLYGTVVSMNDDDSVQLSIAAGVEVKWTLAALRDTAALPDRYRRSEPELEKHTDPPEHHQSGDSAG